MPIEALCAHHYAEEERDKALAGTFRIRITLLATSTEVRKCFFIKLEKRGSKSVSDDVASMIMIWYSIMIMIRQCTV